MAVDMKQIGEQVTKESVVINQIRSEIHKVKCLLLCFGGIPNT
jgi:hypothetical protein